MSLVKVPCPHCQRICGVEESKIPDRAVSFNCPGCKGKVVVDPAKLGIARAPVVGGPAAFEAGGAEELFAADSGPVAHVELPPGATLPRGLVFGANDEVTGQLRGVLEPYGCDLEAADDLAAITELPSEELPPLLVIVAGKVGKPPFDLLEPVVNLAPAARRRTFVVLVAENLNTVDGSQAFFYQVNLVLNAKDLDNTASILYAALQEHRRLFAPLLAAFEAREEL